MVILGRSVAMNKAILLFLVLLVMGCTSKEPDVGLEVPFVTQGCSGISESSSEVRVTTEGLSIVSSILTDKPCYTLKKAEISRKGDDVTLYFTFDSDLANCNECPGVENLIYAISGDGLNKTGVNIKLVAYFNGNETVMEFTS